MNLKNIIEKKDAAAQFMIDEITHICTKFEKRAPGSKGEKQACEYMAKQLKDLGCDETYVDSFKENPDSFYGWIYFTITCCFLALAAYFFMPALSIAFTVCSIVSF